MDLLLYGFHDTALPQRIRLVVSLFPLCLSLWWTLHAFVCLFAVMLCNRCVKWKINACVCEGWLYILNSLCVGEWLGFLLLGLCDGQRKIVVFSFFCLARINARHPEVDWQMWTDAWCWGCSWQKASWVDMERLPILASTLLETSFSSATLSSSKVMCRHSINVTQRPVAQQQSAPAIHVLHKEGWVWPNTPALLLYKGAWIHKVVKGLIRRLKCTGTKLNFSHCLGTDSTVIRVLWE